MWSIYSESILFLFIDWLFAQTVYCLLCHRCVRCNRQTEGSNWKPLGYFHPCLYRLLLLTVLLLKVIHMRWILWHKSTGHIEEPRPILCKGSASGSQLEMGGGSSGSLRLLQGCREGRNQSGAWGLSISLMWCWGPGCSSLLPALTLVEPLISSSMDVGSAFSSWLSTSIPLLPREPPHLVVTWLLMLSSSPGDPA